MGIDLVPCSPPLSSRFDRSTSRMKNVIVRFLHRIIPILGTLPLSLETPFRVPFRSKHASVVVEYCLQNFNSDYEMGEIAPVLASPTDRINFRRHYEFGTPTKIWRVQSADSSTADEWGFFEDFEPSTPTKQKGEGFEDEQPIQRALSLPPPATAAPMYVLESTLATQQLWYSTAGLRPKQPEQERAYFENLWKRNFKNSDVPGVQSLDFVEDNKPKKVRITDEVPFKEYNGDILFRGKGPFSNSVSKSFLDHDVAAMTLQIPRFRIVRSSDGEMHAEFLVVVSVGSHSIVTFGLWRRHSDFSKLALKVQILNSKSGRLNVFKNAMLSWQCLLHRKRWYRCLDKDYLSLKCFLLERFMHDLLFESHSPSMISTFLDL